VYLGNDSPLAGPYTASELWGVAYQSLDALRAKYDKPFREFGTFSSIHDKRPIWMFVGNSFVQAPGMLGDTASALLPDHRIFFLRQNEHLLPRLSVVQTLLESGLKPHRIFVVLVPVDIATIGPQPIATVTANGSGALVYRPRLPPFEFASKMINHSRVAFCAWVRTGQAKGNPDFNPKELYEYIPQRTLSDIELLFGNLAMLQRAHGVPIDIVLVPTWEQVVGNKNWSFQNRLAQTATRANLNVIDPRNDFLSLSKRDRPSLYVPDKHLSASGNRRLLDAIVKHVNSESRANMSRP
jgi:hypothetical protein